MKIPLITSALETWRAGRRAQERAAQRKERSARRRGKRSGDIIASGPEEAERLAMEFEPIIECKPQPPAGNVVRKCVDCGGEYVLTTGERAFYVSRGLSLPRRCSECRAARRQAREQGAA